MNDEQESKHGIEVLGRVINAKCEPLDEKGPIAATSEDKSNDRQILETGVKAIDLLCPFPKGGNIGVFGGGRAWRNAIDTSTDQ
ncbi:hypothetical protein [Pseudomonas glycinae]|uniref:hypothetical protein n=1 Tax=Pseudomonas glycinae TaxID=1785145 RepID=UPI001F1C81BF|nr:hypothetical protein [Pseudomonas glycinae]